MASSFIKRTVIVILLLLTYLIIGSKIHFYIPCPIHFITHLYCPGCGLTRMLLSLLKLDFYQSFRYNPLLFIMLPFFILLLIDNLVCKIKNKVPLYIRIDKKVWLIIIIILIIYGILRNIYLPLAPTVVSRVN